MDPRAYPRSDEVFEARQIQTDLDLMRFLRHQTESDPRSDEVFEVWKRRVSLDLMRFLRKRCEERPRSDEVFEGRQGQAP